MTTYVAESRHRALESAIRDVLAKNIDVRQTLKEEEWKKNNSYLYEDKE